MEEQGKLRRTPLYDAHVALGGRMVPFGGWEMPVQYKSILDEANIYRRRNNQPQPQPDTQQLSIPYAPGEIETMELKTMKLEAGMPTTTRVRA